MTKAGRIIWIPGWACDGASLQPLVAGMGETFDHEFLGWNECLRDWRTSWTIDSFEESNLPGAMLQKLETARDPAYLAGWSMGGMLALRAAMARPDRVRGLILLSTTPHFLHAGNHPTTAGSLRAMRRKLERNECFNVMRDFFRNALHPREDSQAMNVLLTYAMIAFDAPILIRGLEYLASENLCNFPFHLQIPCLQIHGSHDSIVSIACADLGEETHGPHFRELPNQGHMLPLTATEQVTSMITEFLANACT